MQTGFRSFSLKEMEKLAGFRKETQAEDKKRIIPPVGPDDEQGAKN